MKKFISLFLVFSILLLSGNLYAKKKGAELIILKTDGTQVRGELIAVKENSLLLLDRESSGGVSVDIDDISVITIVNKPTFWRGFIPGFFSAGAIGAIWVALDADRDRGVQTAGAFFIFGTLGAILKGVISTIVIENETIKFEDKSDSEIQEIMEKLREKARIKNAQ